MKWSPLESNRQHDWTRRRFMQALALASLGGTVSIESTSAAVAPLERRRAQPFETHPNLETVPGVLITRDGTRLRTYLTRPAGHRDRLPAILFMQWLSCDTIEL